MDRGQTYYKPTGETTEWEDILIKKGIIEPKTKVHEEEDDEVDYTATNVTYDSNEENDVESEDDEFGDDDDRELRRIREKRIAEMKALAARNCFGRVQPITKTEWTREVNEASKHAWVIVYLFDSAVDACKVMDQLIETLAKLHPDVKVVSIPAQACMENWPTKNCPTLFLYSDEELQHQLITLQSLRGLDTTVKDLEEYLVSQHVISQVKHGQPC